MNVDPQQLFEQSKIFFQQKNWVAAESCLQDLLRQMPDSAEVLSNLSYLRYLRGDHAGAIQNAELALNADAEYVPALSNLGMALIAIKHIDRAIAVLERANLLLSNTKDALPNSAIASSIGAGVNLAIAYQQAGQFSKAIQHFKDVLRTNPTVIEAQINLALAYQETGQLEKALQLYETLLTREPQYHLAISNYIMALQYSATQTSRSLIEKTRWAAKNMNEIKTVSIDTTAQVKKSITQKETHNQSQRLRIGFVSPDFYAHPVGWFFQKILIALKQYPVDCFCYYNHSIDDPVTQTIRQNTKMFRRILGTSTNEAKQLIHADEIDVLIDLAGHTAGNRLDLFIESSGQKKSAPKQLAWLGFAASTGIANMDGVLLAEDLITHATPYFFSESIFQLQGAPFVYAAPEYLTQLSNQAKNTQIAYDRNGFITFGCFNNLAKINDAVLTTWAGILHQVPKSRLLLKWKSFADSKVCDAFYRRFHSLGIEKNRVILRAASPHAEMLKEYMEVDIALDTFPFTGALTSYEAIWMGVPVISLAGERPLSRQTYAANKQLGLAECNAVTPQAYKTAAVNLAKNIVRLRELHQTLAQLAQDSPLNHAKLTCDSFVKICQDLVANKN